MKLLLTVFGGILLSLSLWVLLLGAIAQCFILTMSFLPDYRSSVYIGDTEQIVYQKLGRPETILSVERNESGELEPERFSVSKSLVYPDMEPGLTVDLDQTGRVENVHLGSSFIRTGAINPIEVTNLVFLLGLAMFLLFSGVDIANKALMKPLAYSILSAVLANAFYFIAFQVSLGVYTRIAILLGVVAPLVYCWGIYQGWKCYLLRSD